MPNLETRGRESPGAVLLANQRRAASELTNFHRQMRRIGPKGKILQSQKDDAKQLFKRLDAILKGKLYNTARIVYKDVMAPQNEHEIKRIALALYFQGYLKEAHRHALEANVSGDFALFLSSFESVLEFMENKKYFICPVEQLAIDFIILKGSLDACSEACKIASLDFNAATAKYAKQTVKFIRTVESEDKKTA